MTSQPIPQQREMEPEQASRRESMRLSDSPADPRWRVFSFASLARTVAVKSDQKRYNWLDALYLLMVAFSVIGLVYQWIQK